MPDVEVEEVGPLTEEDLLARVSPVPLPAVYITVADYMERHGCGHSTALKKLREKAAAGVVLERKALVDGKEKWIFY